MVTRAFRALALRALAAGALLAPGAAHAQTADHWHYTPGAWNWQFLHRYPEAARLFNAFDYGHSVLYEVLLTTEGAVQRERLAGEYRFLTTDLLVRPPRFAVDEETIEPNYAKLAWTAKEMFEWAHILHRQIYDVYSDERLDDAARARIVEELTDRYLARTGAAFVAVPKEMALMDEQPFSQRFRRDHPAFNGLIWAYHWLQVGLYEPLIAGRTPMQKKEGVQRVVSRFWRMLADSANGLPTVMPMTSAVAPVFSARHPRAAIIFDNLHMMHDIISDILIAPDLTRAEKGREIARQLAMFRDPSRDVMEVEHWRMMAEHMGGVERMGGVAR